MEIWFNPSCSKCRIASSTLDEAGVEYKVVRYLDTPPTADELRSVLKKLKMEPWEIARLKESAAKDAGLDALPKTSENREGWITALVAHPILIQRPILLTEDGKAFVGRSAEALQDAIAAVQGSES